jgi:death-on-curing protein
MEIFLDNAPVKKEFERWSKYFERDDAYETIDTIGLVDVLRAHFLIADYFYGEGYGIAGVGPRDANLLHSSVYRQFVSFGGKDKWTTSFEKCATLLYGLVKDHPFHDANKRTGLLTMLFFLNKMGRYPVVKQKELENFVVDIAEDRLKKVIVFNVIDRSASCYYALIITFREIAHIYAIISLAIAVTTTFLCLPFCMSR